MGTEVFIDEEAALGFHVWVAELELLVGTARGRLVDQVNSQTFLSFDPKMLALTLPISARASLDELMVVRPFSSMVLLS